ncbi:glycoside hydrolase family 18 protein [Penicillium argentinense]|uniref:Glycoside hydrolase family 18 protein n=1 Tax=Penicillium argentinense TaxID=1131581 RepID=A0A9W9EZ20_9EURO|nr:glycoside hydrolase family 18 protein [Penicillium argentinense]KAJ5090545.1 glycoside hydrolase family 18 protein [Penicillium argentinense]
MRRDNNNTSLCIDYSNVAGYWKAIVDSPREESESSSDKAQTTDQCHISGEDYEEGFGAFVAGTLDASIYYEASGFMTVDGTTDLTYGIAGIGDIDMSKSGEGNPATSEGEKTILEGNTASAGKGRNFVTFSPYYKTAYQIATLNGSSESDWCHAATPFNRKLSTRVILDLGNLTAYFLPQSEDKISEEIKSRKANKISTGEGNAIYSTSGDGGVIFLSTFIRFGMDVEFSIWFPPLRP